MSVILKIKKLNNLQNRVIFGFFIFWILLVSNTWNTSRISIKNMEEKIIQVKTINKSFGKDSTEYNLVITSLNGKDYSVLPDFNKCLDFSFFKCKLKSKKIRIKVYGDMLREPFVSPHFIYSLKYNNIEYLDRYCMKSESNNNFILSILFGFLLFPILIFATYLDKVKK